MGVPQIIYINRIFHYRRKFRSQTSDNMDEWKAEQGLGREKRKIRRKKSRRERVRRKRMQMREKVVKSQNTVFFQWFGAPEGRKVGLLKRRVRSQLARWEMKNCTLLWREVHLQVKMHKAHHCRTTLWRKHILKSKCTKHTILGPLWKFRCGKSARRCGAKHISKWKYTKHITFGPLLEVVMSKKCTPLWREAHFEVKMYKTHHSRTTLEVPMWKKCTPLWREAHFEVKIYKTHHVRTTFGSCDVEKVHAVVARSTFRNQNVQNTPFSDNFWRFRCRFASLHYTTLHYTTLHYTTLHYITLHSTTLQLQLHNYTPRHSTTLHDTPLHSTTPNYYGVAWS